MRNPFKQRAKALHIDWHAKYEREHEENEKRRILIDELYKQQDAWADALDQSEEERDQALAWILRACTLIPQMKVRSDRGRAIRDSLLHLASEAQAKGWDSDPLRAKAEAYAQEVMERYAQPGSKE